MTRTEIESRILTLFREEYEIEDPGVDDDLREVHKFDSIDAVELLASIEDMLGRELSQDDRKRAMEIRTLRQVIDFIVAVDEAQVTEREP